MISYSSGPVNFSAQSSMNLLWFLLVDTSATVKFIALVVGWHTLKFKQDFLKDSCQRVLTTGLNYVFLFLLKLYKTTVTMLHIFKEIQTERYAQVSLHQFKTILHS